MVAWLFLVNCFKHYYMYITVFNTTSMSQSLFRFQWSWSCGGSHWLVSNAVLNQLYTIISWMDTGVFIGVTLSFRALVNVRKIFMLYNVSCSKHFHGNFMSLESYNQHLWEFSLTAVSDMYHNFNHFSATSSLFPVSVCTRTVEQSLVVFWSSNLRCPVPYQSQFSPISFHISNCNIKQL